MVSQLLTLYITPVIYLALDRFSGKGPVTTHGARLAYSTAKAGLHGFTSEGLIDDRGCLRFHSDSLEAGLAGLQHFAATGDGATSADTGHEVRHGAVGVAPNFRASRFNMCPRIIRIGKLIKQSTSTLSLQLQGVISSKLHTARSCRQNEFSTISGHTLATFNALIFWHH